MSRLKLSGIYQVDWALTGCLMHGMIVLSPQSGALTEGMMTMAQFNTAQVAEKLETTPRTLRKFLRADAREQGTETPGKGSRYSIEGKQLASLKKRFNAWTEAQAAKVEVDEVPDAS